MNINNKASINYKIQILENGEVVSERPFKHNLILDVGLDSVAVRSWANCFTYCALGTGSDPVKRDSAATTASQTTTTVTSSGNFFEAADVGRLLKFDSGEEVMITGFTSATVVTVADSATVASSEFTIWYVNRTGLQTELVRFNSKSTDGGDNSTGFTSNVLTLKRTFLSAAFGSAATVTELGWSWAGAGSLFGMDTLGAGDAVGIGQQYKVVVELALTFSPTTQQTIVDYGNNGFNTAGLEIWAYSGFNSSGVSGIASLDYVDSNGNTIVGDGSRPSGMEPSAQSVLNIHTATFTLPSSINDGVTTNVGGQPLNSTGYTSGAFTLTKTAVAAVGGYNGSIFGFSVGGSNNNFYTTGPAFITQKFTATQTKDSDHELRLSAVYSWGRNLTN